MNFLLTGGTGFLGINLAKKILSQNNHLTLVSRNSPESKSQISELVALGAESINCTETNYLSKVMSSNKKFDVVIHLAAHYSRKHNESEVRPMLDAAVTLGSEMLEIAKNQKSRFFHAGSYLEYMDEEVHGRSLYVESKRAFEHIARYYAKSESVAVTKMIFFDTYGKGDSRDKVLNKMFAAKLAHSKVTLNNPHQLIDLTHVSDVVEGILQTVINPWVEVVRINSGNFIKIASLQELVLQISETSPIEDKTSDELLDDFPALAFNPPDHWIPKVGLRVGLKRMQETEF